MAKSFSYKKVKYTVIDDANICVAENKSFAGPLVIPETIEKGGVTYRVTEIGNFWLIPSSDNRAYKYIRNIT